MRAKLILLLVFVSAAIVVGIKTSPQILSQSSSDELAKLEEKEKRGSLTIKERVELAKIRGKKQVFAQTIVTLQPVAASPEEIEELLPRYTIVLAEATEQFGYLSDARSIMSWYKFRIIDVLTQAPPQQTFAIREIPEQLLPLKDDEFLVPTAGGTATLDGVEVIQIDQTIPRLKKSKKYLLLLSLNPSTRIAELALGPQSILPVNTDNSLDTNVNKHTLQQAIRKFHNSSIDQLKRNINK